MRSRTAASLIVLIATAAVALAGRQARDAGAQSPKVVVPSGTAVLSGVLVTDTPTPQPVRRATVRLTGAAGTSVRLAGTDDEGRFVFPALPAASYTLSAAKTGFVQSFHGSKRPGRGPGVPVAVGDGAHVSVTLKILLGAVITGTITDSHGRPAASVPVAVVEVQQTGTTVAAPARTNTDDRGIYRISGLPPGDYLVSALPRLSTGRGAAAPDVLAVTDAEVQWARNLLASPLGVGAGGAPMPAAGRPVTFAPVYFPGTTDATVASRVTVTAGEERSGVGFALRVVTTSTIAGTLLDQNGQPITVGSVTLHPRWREQPSVADLLISTGALTMPRAIMAAPQFSIGGVTPGEYTLVARTGAPGRGTVAAAATQTPPLWNLTDVTIDGRDVTDLVLRLQPGMRISGSIVFDRTSLTPPADSSGTDISMVSARSLVGAPALPRATVDPAGTFRFSSVNPGSYALKAVPPSAPAGARWTLKSAMLNGRDLADALLDVKPGQDLSGLVITFTDRPTEIAGSLVDAGNRPVTRYSIVVFTVDRTLWLPNARRIRSAAPATDGSFSIAGLPAGEYAIGAVEDLEASDLADAAFLFRLLAASLRITLADGEKKTQNLRAGSS